MAQEGESDLTKTYSRAHSLAMTHGSMHMERDFGLAITDEGMHALEVKIPDIDWGLSVHPIAKSNELSSCHAILDVDKGGILDHELCSTNDMNSPRSSTNDMNSPKVTGVRQQMRSEQPGHNCHSPTFSIKEGPYQDRPPLCPFRL